MTSPSRFPRRSFVYRQLLNAGAEFAEIGDAAVAVRYPGRGGLASRLALADFSPLPRCGFKGPLALSWLRDQGAEVPEANNQAILQPDGSLIARLADTEALLLGDIDPSVDAADWWRTTEPGEGCYPAPRRDSHAWFLLCGQQAPECLAKLCGVDLRPRHFDALEVAQTMVARLPAIVIRHDRGGVWAYHLLADSASAVYFWDALIDAMGEFFGGPAGLNAVRELNNRTPADGENAV